MADEPNNPFPQSDFIAGYFGGQIFVQIEVMRLVLQ
jgi:hypothetical protein